jgi:putative ABC transport system ATP-binding protein
MTGETEPVVIVRGVNHHLGMGSLRRQILFDISAEIAPGELVTVMGPSGSGKTTLLTLIGALRTLTDVSLRVFGTELRDASQAQITRIRRRLGFVFQHHHLIESLTACKNVEVGLGASGLSRDERRRRAIAMLEGVGLQDHVHSYPNQLSGGQCQRVAVSRALVRDPELILADEPTASLDKQSGREIVELLRRLARQRGCSVIMVTHDPRILDVADRLMYLEDGRLSSFSAITSAHSVHLLTALRPLAEGAQLSPFIAKMGQADFIDMMRSVGAESEQFLNVLDFGGLEEMAVLFPLLTRVALDRVRSQVEARAARIWAGDGSAAPRCICASPSTSGQANPVVMEALRAAEPRHDGDTLCIPLETRDCQTYGLMEFDGVPSRALAERTFRDFVRPFGLLAQLTARLEGMDG